MLKRAGFTPDQHVENLARVQKKEGADAVKLGAVSGQQYKEIFRSRAFDQYFFQIPPKKRSGVQERVSEKQTIEKTAQILTRASKGVPLLSHDNSDW